MSMYHLSIEFV